MKNKIHYFSSFILRSTCSNADVGLMIVYFDFGEKGGRRKIVTEETANDERRGAGVGEMRQQIATTHDGERMLIYYTFAAAAAPENKEKGTNENV